MDQNNEKLNMLLSEVTKFSDIALQDIPDIDLYMDQVTTLFEKKFSSSKRDEDDKIMTKTMINNYAKAKIFPPVKSKKYNKEQIILLALIYNLKQNLSLIDIGAIFAPILDDVEKKEKKLPTIDKLYDTFLEIKKLQLENFQQYFYELTNTISEKTNHLGGEEQELKELILTVFMLINQANIQRRMAEKIIDNFFKRL